MTPNSELISEARRLTLSLGGTWSGTSGMACCPSHDDSSPSLSIGAGRSTVLLHCFAGCNFIDILAAIRSRGELRRGNLPSDHSAAAEPATRDFASAARRIWSEARSVTGTLAERYLEGRGLIGPWDELRFNGRTPIGSGALVQFRPALIAAVRDNSGIIAVHRIALDPQTGRKAADLENPKLTLGKPRRGAVRLSKAGRVLGLAEGVETAKSAARRKGIPVWAVLGAERFPLVDIPFDVSHLILLPDRGAAGARAAKLAHEAYQAAGRTIETDLPPHGYDDWNALDQDEP